jgi:hypothetical protein
VPNREPFLPKEIRARLRAPVDLGAGARARVMQRVRAVALLGRVVPHPRGNVRPTVLGALLAASFVAAVITAGAHSTSGADWHTTLADTIAMRFDTAADASDAEMQRPVIDPKRMMAVADETRDPAPNPGASAAIRRN